jgi:hypothetical protein
MPWRFIPFLYCSTLMPWRVNVRSCSSPLNSNTTMDILKLITATASAATATATAAQAHKITVITRQRQRSERALLLQLLHLVSAAEARQRARSKHRTCRKGAQNSSARVAAPPWLLSIRKREECSAQDAGQNADQLACSEALRCVCVRVRVCVCAVGKVCVRVSCESSHVNAFVGEFVICSVCAWMIMFLCV